MLNANNTADFFHFILFSMFWKYFSITFYFFLYLFPENKLLSSNRLWHFNIKSINPIQKYLHIIESYACILKTFVVIFLLPINLLISFGMCSALKLSKYVDLLDAITLSSVTNKISNEFQLIYTQNFKIY